MEEKTTTTETTTKKATPKTTKTETATPEIATVPKDKVLSVIKEQKQKYRGKVVLAMSEVVDILSAIENCIKE